MSEIRELMEALVTFQYARDWQQFHDSKNLAVALSIEAAELNEVFLWKVVKASEEVVRKYRLRKLMPVDLTCPIQDKCFLMNIRRNYDLIFIIKLRFRGVWLQ
jgi:hypothetical protein